MADVASGTYICAGLPARQDASKLARAAAADRRRRGPRSSGHGDVAAVPPTPGSPPPVPRAPPGPPQVPHHRPAQVRHHRRPAQVRHRKGRSPPEFRWRTSLSVAKSVANAGWPLSRAAVADQPSGRGRAAGWLRPLSGVVAAAPPGRRGRSAGWLGRAARWLGPLSRGLRPRRRMTAARSAEWLRRLSRVAGPRAGWPWPRRRVAGPRSRVGWGRLARWLGPLSRAAVAAVRSAVPAVIRPAGPGRRGLSAAAAVMKPILCARTAGTTEQPAPGRTRRLITTGTAERAPTPSSPPKGTFATELSVANVPFGGVVGRGRLRRATVTAGGGRPPRRQGVRVRSGVRSGPGAGR